MVTKEQEDRAQVRTKLDGKTLDPKIPSQEVVQHKGNKLLPARFLAQQTEDLQQLAQPIGDRHHQDLLMHHGILHQLVLKRLRQPPQEQSMDKQVEDRTNSLLLQVLARESRPLHERYLGQPTEDLQRLVQPIGDRHPRELLMHHGIRHQLVLKRLRQPPQERYLVQPIETLHQPRLVQPIGDQPPHEPLMLHGIHHHLVLKRLRQLPHERYLAQQTETPHLL